MLVQMALRIVVIVLRERPDAWYRQVLRAGTFCFVWKVDRRKDHLDRFHRQR